MLCKANQKDKQKKVSSINRFGNARNGYIQIRAPEAAEDKDHPRQ